MEDVRLVRVATQLDRQHYSGHVKIGEKIQFDYTLELCVPVDQVRSRSDQCATIPEFMEAVKLTLKNGQKQLDLSEDEYFLFLRMLIDWVVKQFEVRSTTGNLLGFMVGGPGGDTIVSETMISFGEGAAILDSLYSR